MPFTYAQVYIYIECGVCATPDGMDEVCESEIMQGRASPCVALRKPSGETLNSMSQLAGSPRAFSLHMLILLRLACGDKSRRRSIKAALHEIRSLSLISDYGVSTSKVASLVRQSVKGSALPPSAPDCLETYSWASTFLFQLGSEWWCSQRRHG